jgi:hypothetical protein
MNGVLKIIPIVLYCIVGIICLYMAFKNILAKKYLPFHEKAAGRLWDDIEEPMKLVILTFMRLSALGFLIISILLIVYPVVNLFIQNIFYQYSIPVLALIYSAGLFIINFSLYKKTNVETPWKGSLYASFIILCGIIISMFC